MDVIIYDKFWDIETAKKYPDYMFIFGDNDIKKGKGGQAVIRDQANAYGIPTKKLPSNTPSSFYTDDEYKENIKKIDKAIQTIKDNKHLYRGIIYPKDGLGTGLAQLDTKAPKTFNYLNSAVQELLNEARNGGLIENISKLPLPQVKKYLQKADLKQLHNLKLYLDDLYYNTGKSTISDDIYDLIKDTLTKRDPNYIPPVGAKIREGENRTELPFWLGSADKITPNDKPKLDKWIKDNPCKEIVITQKLDGVSCLLTYTNNTLKLYTRGDGIIGADISYLAKYFNIPELNFPINIRGELIMPKAIFEEKHTDTYKNPRNMVSGLIGSKTSRKGLDDIHFVVYEIVGDSMPKPSAQLLKLKDLGFETVESVTIKSNQLSISVLSDILVNYKQTSSYDIDGIIVQANVPYHRNTSGNPDYMFAFKMTMDEDIHTTKVLSIEWNTSKWGQLKPVVIVEPVELNDITMSRATAHTAKYVEENELGPGSIIKITRSKDVIPYIVEVVKGTKAQMPDQEYTWDKNHVNISVVEFDSNICIKLISSFFEKLGIKNIAEGTVARMYNNGLDNLLDIIAADKNRLSQVPEFKEKSVERIYTGIRNGLKNVKLSTIIGASGVLGYGIGRKKMDTLFLAIPNLLDIYKKKTRDEMIDLISSVDGFSSLTANKIVDNLKYASLFILRLKKTGIVSFQTQERISDTLVGKKFVMSGFRDKNLEEQINQRGGKVTTSVSGQTSGVILAHKGGKLTGKPAKAQELGIPIYDKEEFINTFLSTNQNEKKSRKNKV